MMTIGSEAITSGLMLSAQKGALFPIKIISNLFNGTNMNEIEDIELKTRTLFFIERNEKTSVSDIVEYLKIEPSRVIGIINKLEEENKIKRIN